MSAYRDKLLSIAAPRKWGTSAKKPVQNENNGTLAGYHTEHWSGRIDATVLAQPAKAGVKKE